MKIDNNSHNHEFVPLSTYPSVRKLTESQREQVIALHNAGVPIRTIISTFQLADKNFCATPKDIDNVIQVSRREKLAEKALLQQVSDEVKLLPSHRRLKIYSLIRSLLDSPTDEPVAKKKAKRNPVGVRNSSTFEHVDGQGQSQPPLPLSLSLPSQPQPQPQLQSINVQPQPTNVQPQGYRRRCGICNVSGHNARTCKLRPGSVVANPMPITDNSV